MRRLLWIDTETTGLDPIDNGIIQLAMLVENSQGKVVDKLNIRFKPFEGCKYDDVALKINKKTIVEISEYMSEEKAFIKIIAFLEKNFFEGRNLRFSVAGYNTPFDISFIKQLFLRNTKIRYDHFFNHYDVDIYALVKVLDLKGTLDNKICKKLGAICNTMGVELKDAHDALRDIKATRKLNKKIRKKFILQ